MRGNTPPVRWLWWTALGLVAANGILLAFLVLPEREQRLKQEDQLLQLQRRIRSLQREFHASEQAVSTLREVKEFAEGYPRRAELVGLIEQLTKQGRSLAVEIPSVDYKPSQVKEASLTKVTIQMGVEGPYAKIRRFLYELERMRRFLVIERVSLRDPKGTSELQLQLQLAVYLR
jgi:Tfp pilus assembly protein PilO